MIGWYAANQASLVVAGRGALAGSMRFLVRSLGGVSMQGVLMERSVRFLVWSLGGVSFSMQGVLMERSDWIHFEIS